MKTFTFDSKEKPEDIVSYLEIENNYFNYIMRDMVDIQKVIYNEIANRVEKEITSPPWKIRNYYYYYTVSENQEYKTFYRSDNSSSLNGEIILDANNLSQEHKYFRLGGMEISPDDKLLAYSVDTTGKEIYRLYIKDLTCNKLLDELPSNIGDSFAWASDNTLLYTVVDAANRPYKIVSHAVNKHQKNNNIIFQENDPEYWVAIRRSKSGQYLFIDIYNHATKEVRYAKSDNIDEPFKTIFPRKIDVRYSVEHHNESFVIVTNCDAENSKLITITIDGKNNLYKTIIPHKNNTTIEDIEIFAKHFVIYEREECSRKIRVINILDGTEHYIDFNFTDSNYLINGEDNYEINTNIFRFRYESIISPPTIFDYNLDTKTLTTLQCQTITDYKKGEYQSEMIYAENNGTRIPLTIFSKKGSTKSGNNPLYLYVYGAYGLPVELPFSSYLASLLSRDFIIAIAHVRGGGEMGERWHKQGSLLNKKNSINDFIVCLEHLIQAGYSSSDKIIVSGGSAGGLIVGAAVNQRPDIIGCVILRSPFLDLINTMQDETLPLTQIEYNEWGNPNKDRYLKYMQEYSPCDNVTAQHYPNMLVMSSLYDTRVSIRESIKWVSKLRELKKDSNILLLKTDMHSGHLGKAGRYEVLNEAAWECAFLLKCLGSSYSI
jgi:oligopeptidase B